MQREISGRVFLRQNVPPFENAGLSDAIDRTASNYKDAKDKVKKIRELVKKQETMMLILLHTSLEFLK